MVKTANLRNVTSPTTLANGEDAHVTGNMINTGTEATKLIVDMIDVDTNTKIASSGTGGTVSPNTIIPFSLYFTMPNRDFKFELRLHD